MLAKFSGLNPKGPYLSLEKEKENFCVVLTYSINQAREIRKLHVAVVQQRLRNVQKRVMHVQSCFFFANLRTCLHERGGPQVGEVTWGGLPHLTCKLDHIQMRNYMDRRVTPPKRVTSPIWGTPPPCKQALNLLFFCCSPSPSKDSLLL